MLPDGTAASSSVNGHSLINSYPYISHSLLYYYNTLYSNLTAMKMKILAPL